MTPRFTCHRYPSGNFRWIVIPDERSISFYDFHLFFPAAIQYLRARFSKVKS